MKRRELLEEMDAKQSGSGGQRKRVIFATGKLNELASLGFVEPEKTDHAEPQDIHASTAGEERRIFGNRRRDARTS